MAKNRAAQPGSIKPRMTKLFDGRNMATRPIPVIHDTSDDRAIAASAADQRPKGENVNMPSGPRPKAGKVLGKKISGGGKVRAGVYNPPGVETNR